MQPLIPIKKSLIALCAIAFFLFSCQPIESLLPVVVQSAPTITLKSESATENSLGVSWTAGESDSKLLGYEVRYSADDKVTYTGKFGFDITDYTFTGLTLGVAYKFDVKAHYINGESQLSQPATITLGPPLPFKIISITLVTRPTRQVFVTWESAQAVGLPILSYSVQYAEETENPKWKNIDNINKNMTYHSIDSSELDSSAKYMFRVKAVTSNPNFFRDTDVHTTGIDISPSDAPTNFASEVGDAGNEFDQIKITWEAPNNTGIKSSESDNTLIDATIVEYKISWSKSIETQSLPTTQTVKAPTTNYTITGLDENTEYSISIVAINDALDNKNTSKALVGTAKTKYKEIYLQAPGDFALKQVTENSITVQWKMSYPGRDIDGNLKTITKYKISYRKGTKDDKDKITYTEPYTTVAEDIDSGATEYTILNLDRYQLYGIKIQAFNSTKDEEVTDEGRLITFATLNAATSNVPILAAPTNFKRVSATRDSLSFSWDAPPNARPGDVKEYRIWITGGGSSKGGRTTATSFTRSGLDPDTTYIIEIYAINQEDQGGATLEGTMTTTQ